MRNAIKRIPPYFFPLPLQSYHPRPKRHPYTHWSTIDIRWQELRDLLLNDRQTRIPPSLHPPPFDKLPTEVVQDIFSLACPDAILHPEGAIVPFHIKLGLVCAKWHSIVAAHHSLWATFEIDAEGAWNPKFGVYLRKYLRQSGTHPLMILVVGRGREEVLSEVLDIIIPHCERWHSIKLDFPLEYRFLQKLVAVRDRLPLLRRLRIAGSLRSYPLGTQDFAIFRNAPLLDRITVDQLRAAAALHLVLHNRAPECFSRQHASPSHVETLSSLEGSDGPSLLPVKFELDGSVGTAERRHRLWFQDLNHEASTLQSFKFNVKSLRLPQCE